MVGKRLISKPEGRSSFRFNVEPRQLPHNSSNSRRFDFAMSGQRAPSSRSGGFGMKTLSESHARFVTGLWRPRFAPGLVVIAVLLLAGCTASQPVAYQQPMPRYYDDGPVLRPTWWNSGPGGYSAPAPPAPPPYYAPPAQAAPPPTYIPNVIPRAEAAEPYRPTYTPTPAAAPNPPPTYSPRPLPTVTYPPPASSDCGWWDPCHLWN
jgi:hypothetical protein